ncbi:MULTISPECIES: hypothetical protein [Serratia]|uniref:Uncharacterized protein n=9 Tax=Serratia TaxID=613 RepID=A0AAW6X9D6_9GAMM|nr:MULTISPECIES: hypothetical protein [Serratia]KAB5493578.1 hypothetical protein F8564_22095 [Enterobacter sp. RJAL6]MDI6934312.1 hypothetical protein [Serratia sp. Se-PFBMAAmG]QHI80585.1 hypothetical protein GUC32_03985 [Serratia sp. NGAS9]WIF09009.1 hypothetical protein QEP77_18850 [Serratia sp. B1]AUO04880.1 hypothetical protein C0558_05640 [Serratia marcescens]
MPRTPFFFAFFFTFP